MKQNSKYLLLIAILILPWFTTPLLGRNTLKKYLPASIFICINTIILDRFGERKRWWRFYKGIPPLNSMDFFVLGPYFVSGLWMLKWTYGKFLLYLTSNLILHTLFVFVGLKYLERFRILSLVKLKKFQYLGVHFLRALIFYAFQFLKDKIQREM